MQYFPHLCILHKKFIKFNYKIKSKKNMKKFKFGVLAMALVSMLGFTSCLDSGDPGPNQRYMCLRAKSGLFGGVTFEDPSGFEYIPSNSMSLSAPTSQLALVYFTYEAETLTQESKSVDVTLLQDPAYLNIYGALNTSVPASSETVSIYNLPTNNAFIWGYNEYLVLSPLYYLKNGTTSSDLKEELANHKLTVYYDSSEEVTNKTLPLHLRYQITGIDGTDEDWGTDYNNVGYTDYAYINLKSFVSQYKAVHGEEPEKVSIEFEKFGNTSIPTMNPDKKMSQVITLEMIEVSDENLK